MHSREGAMRWERYSRRSSAASAGYGPAEQSSPNDLYIWILLILAIGGCCLLSSHADNQSRSNLEQQAASSNDSSDHPDTLPQDDTPALKTHLRKLNNRLYQHIYWPILISGLSAESPAGYHHQLGLCGR